MNYSVSRRQLLQAGAVTATAAIGATLLHTPDAKAFWLGKWVQEMPRLPMRTGAQNLSMAAGTHQFHPWFKPSPTWGYGGMAYGGPVIEARVGTPQAITFSNKLGSHIMAANISTKVHGTRPTDAAQPRSTVHMHGALVKSQFDGHPEDVFFPGQSKTYLYTNQQEACHLWYHDHSLGLTRLNVYAGLAGQYLLRDNWDSGESNVLGLPSGDCEIPLMLQDKAVNYANGQLIYSPGLLTQGAWFPGTFGDLSIVNGAAFPKITVARGVYRFRILNAANSRFYTLSMSNRAYFHVIGNDQGMLNTAALTQTLTIAPGERYDVLIDFTRVTPGTSVVVYNSDVPENNGWLFGHFNEVLRFDVSSATGRFTRMPNRLRGGVNQRALVPHVDTIRPVRERNISLNIANDQICGGIAPVAFRINNMNYNDGMPEVVKAGQWEQWNIINATIDTHPFHVHMAEIRIKGRQKLDTAKYNVNLPPFAQYWAPAVTAEQLTSSLAPPAAWEAGMKDTVIVPPNTVTRIMVRIPTQAECGVDPTASFVNKEGKTLSGYMFHCHLLEHEDCDMMRPMEIVV